MPAQTTKEAKKVKRANEPTTSPSPPPQTADHKTRTRKPLRARAVRGRRSFACLVRAPRAKALPAGRRQLRRRRVQEGRGAPPGSSGSSRIPVLLLARLVGKLTTKPSIEQVVKRRKHLYKRGRSASDKFFLKPTATSLPVLYCIPHMRSLGCISTIQQVYQ